MANIVKVGMADLNVCKSPEGITTLGLGSCVGICIRDPVLKIGGMAHAMLPDSRQIEHNSNSGAQMFAFQNKSDMTRVGERNVEASKKKLKELGIPLKAQDTGLNYGRTIIFYPETGDLVIRSAGKPEKTI